MTNPIHTRCSAILAVALAVALIGASAAPVAAQSTADPAFIVEVHDDGSATVSVRSTFDLTTDAERAAFRTLMDDDQAKRSASDRFLDRMRAVASDAENATGREMQVTDASIDLRRSTDNETGIVTLSVTWAGLAAVDGETLVLGEPFASGFTTDRAFVVEPPEGYEITSASPEPEASEAGHAIWNAGTDLSGLEVEMQPTATDTSPADGPAQTDGQPGFGWLVALLALLGGSAVAGWMRARDSA